MYSSGGLRKLIRPTRANVGTQLKKKPPEKFYATTTHILGAPQLQNKM